MKTSFLVDERLKKPQVPSALVIFRVYRDKINIAFQCIFFVGRISFGSSTLNHPSYNRCKTFSFLVYHSAEDCERKATLIIIYEGDEHR